MVSHQYAPATSATEALRILGEYPRFATTLHQHFPQTLPLQEYMVQTSQALHPYGLRVGNTMGMVAACRDELADPLFHQVVKFWGKTFNCCSLGGFLTLGRTGLAAALAHTPIEAGIHRFIFFAMPHIAISRYGDVGLIYRQGLQEVSHACGALEKIIEELHSGKINVQIDLQDLEHSILRQRILSSMRYGAVPDLVDITHLSCRLIAHDVWHLLQALALHLFHYGVMLGIQIHGPDDSQWIYPYSCYVVKADSHPDPQVIAHLSAPNIQPNYDDPPPTVPSPPHA